MSEGDAPERLLRRLRQHETQRSEGRGARSRFRPLRLLGRGGMGEVVLAWDEALKREVALKELHSGSPALRELQRFETEARAMAALRHPHIVRVHELVRERGRRYLVLDYVAGGSLRERLEQEGPLPPDEALRIALALAEALEHAHARGVLHRDVKPANVLLNDEGQVFLTDFGLAKLRDSSLALTESGQIVGTPGYLPPEQITDSKHGDPRSDVYALGATLYAMLTGEPPFRAENLQALICLVLEAPAPDPRARRPDVPGELAQVCARCLAKAPAARYPDASALADDLRALREGRRLRRVAPQVGWGALLGAALLGGALAALWPTPAGESSRRARASTAAASPSPTSASSPPPTPAAEAPAPHLDGLVVPVRAPLLGVTYVGARADRLLVSDARGLRLWALEPAGPRELWSKTESPPGALLSAPDGSGALCRDPRGGVSFLDGEGTWLRRQRGELTTSATFVRPGAWLVAWGKPIQLSRHDLNGEPRGPPIPLPVRTETLAWDARNQTLCLGSGDTIVPGPVQLEVRTLDPWTRRAAWLMSSNPSAVLPGRQAGEWIVGLETGSLLVLSVQEAPQPPDFPAPRAFLVSTPGSLPPDISSYATYPAHVGHLARLGLTPEGLLVSVSGYSGRLHDLGDVRVWDLQRRELVGVALRLQVERVADVSCSNQTAFSRDGRYLALPTPDGLGIFATAELVARARRGRSR